MAEQVIKSRCEWKFATICSLVSCVVFLSKYTNVQKKCIHSCKLCWFAKEQRSKVNFSPAGGALSMPYFFPPMPACKEGEGSVFVLLCLFSLQLLFQSWCCQVSFRFGSLKNMSVNWILKEHSTCFFSQDPDRLECPALQSIL